MPKIDMDDRTHQTCHFHTRALQTSDTEEVVPQDEMGVNPYEGLTQSHKGWNVQDP
jgi:hypothetical protein